MSCLHLILRSPSQGLLNTCATLLQPGDGILFLEDGVYYCGQPNQLPKFGPDVELYCLREDLGARGLTELDRPRIDAVDYGGFVALCCEFDKIISWF